MQWKLVTFDKYQSNLSICLPKVSTIRDSTLQSWRTYQRYSTHETKYSNAPSFQFSLSTQQAISTSSFIYITKFEALIVTFIMKRKQIFNKCLVEKGKKHNKFIFEMHLFLHFIKHISIPVVLHWPCSIIIPTENKIPTYQYGENYPQHTT